MSGEPLLVAYAYKFDAERILKRLPQARRLKTSQDIDDWNAGKIQVLVVHPLSAGHGLNLQHGGHNVCWYGLDWSLENYIQTNARLDRNGQKHRVIIHRIVVRNTIDEDIVARLVSHQDVLDVLMTSLKRRVKEAA